MIAHLLIAGGVAATMLLYGAIQYERGYQRRIVDRARFERMMNEAISRSVDLAEADIAAKRFIADLERI